MNGLKEMLIDRILGLSINSIVKKTNKLLGRESICTLTKWRSN